MSPMCTDAAGFDAREMVTVTPTAVMEDARAARDKTVVEGVR